MSRITSRRLSLTFTAFSALLILFTGFQNLAQITNAAAMRAFAPYVDVTLWPPFGLPAHAQATGVRSYSLGFIVAKGFGDCRASWGTYYLMTEAWYLNEVQQLRALGGDVIVSFGGAANQELAEACADVASLKAQYKSVMDAYGVTQLDFDIEGGAITNAAANTRRAQALAQLQAELAPQGKSPRVSYTLPVLPQGLTNDGVALVKNALVNGVNVEVWNIMAMDYGDSAAPNPNGQMGKYAIDAAKALFAQLKAAYQQQSIVISDADLWAKVSITPMIGQNDVPSEVFTQADARQVLAFAQQQNIGRLAMWSANRDKACAGTSGALYECTKIAQTPNEFALIFRAFTSGAGPTPMPTPMGTRFPIYVPAVHASSLPAAARMGR